MSRGNLLWMAILDYTRSCSGYAQYVELSHSCDHIAGSITRATDVNTCRAETKLINLVTQDSCRCVAVR